MYIHSYTQTMINFFFLDSLFFFIQNHLKQSILRVTENPSTVAEHNLINKTSSEHTSLKKSKVHIVNLFDNVALFTFFSFSSDNFIVTSLKKKN